MRLKSTCEKRQAVTVTENSCNGKMNLCIVFLILLTCATLIALRAASEVTSSPSPLENSSKKINATQNSTNSGFLSRLFNFIQLEKDRQFVAVPENCTIPSLTDSVIRNFEYQFFCYRIKTDGIARFHLLRQKMGSVASYSEFKHLLFPSKAEHRHPFFGCAFDMFFNHLMNRTPFIWLQWVDFEGYRLPFIWWQQVNV